MATFSNSKYSITVNQHGTTSNGKIAANVTATPWTGGGKSRIYIKMAYACGGYKQDCGYICLDSAVPTFVNPYKGNNKWHADNVFTSAVAITEIATPAPVAATKLPVCKSSLMRLAHQIRRERGLGMGEALKAAWATYKNA